MLLHLVIVISCVKLLLLPCYTSTDFEVHRNWLAITHSLPIDQWYVEATSEWTLDYPPFFAWFEYGLAKIASALNVDQGKLLQIENLNHKSLATVFFQRFTVIITDLVLAFGVKLCCVSIRSRQYNELTDLLPTLVLTNAGLIMVDHIHFQYNGFLLGLLLLSIGFMMSEWYLSSALIFAALLNFKHIYIYCAPVFFVYLMSTYCLKNQSLFSLSISRLAMLAIIVLGVFGLSFGPFVARGQLMIVLQRLFPFKRGLTHAYWAPNFWALYNLFDRLAISAFRKIGLETWLKADCQSTPTGGLVQDTVHCVLPNIPPFVTFAFTLAAQLPILWKLWHKRGDSVQFLRAVILCNFTSFIFGWHVHEKAILLVTVPMAVLSVVSPNEAGHFLVLSTVGNFSLFPLLYEDRETVIKILLTLGSLAIAYHTSEKRRKNWQRPLKLIQKFYLFVLIPVFIVCHVLLPYLVASMPFLPLMMYSVFCSVGILYEFCGMYSYFMKVN